MEESLSMNGSRGKYEGMFQILRFNWPVYVAAVLVCLAVLGAVVMLPMLYRVRWLAWSAIACTGYWTVASLLASHWIYDRSRIYQWTWIRENLPWEPSHWANIHAGLDQSSAALKRMFPDSNGTVLDIFDPSEMTEASISEARRSPSGSVASHKADFRSLPPGDGELDAVFLIFAAHEIRKRESRLAFFKEVRRVLKPRGGVLMIEHLRDLNNFLAFGPGCFHFQTRSAWLNASRDAQLELEKEFRITPFITIFLLRSR